MKRYIAFFGFFTSLCILAGCAQLPTHTPGSAILAQVDNISVGPMQTRPAVVEFNGKSAILYATTDDRVAFQIGETKQLLDETARVKGSGRFFQLKRDGQNLGALWWSHLDGKNGYYTSSIDGGQHFAPVSVVNPEHGILSPLSLVNDQKGKMGISYLDERASGYQVYFNRTLDGGRTWGSTDQRLDAAVATDRTTTVYEPQTVKAGATWVAVWADFASVAGSYNYRILSRRSVDAGETWTNEQVIYSTGHQPTSLKLRSFGSTVVLGADEVTHGIFALTSNDEGSTWAQSGFLPGTASFTNSGIEMSLAEGRAHLVWMQEQPNEKVRVMVGSLDSNKSTWLDSSRRLDVKEYNNTKAWLPVVLATAQGPVITAWLDYRDIRPNIYLSTSFDRGQTWTPPQALLEPGAVSAGWPQLLSWGADKAAIAYEIYPGDKNINQGSFVVRQLELEDGNAVGLRGLLQQKPVNENERKSRLVKRIQELWASRVAGNYDKAYDFFDYAYRNSTTKQIYTANTGVINYLAFEVDSISVTGNEASVNMKVKYEVKTMTVPYTGKPLEIKPMDTEAPTKWVWVGNDWYIVYSPSFDVPILKY